MNLNTYIVCNIYFMALVGLGAASLVKGVEPAFVASVGVIVAVSAVFRSRKRTFIRSRAFNVIAVSLFALFVLDYLSISESLMVAATRFSTLLLALKLFDLTRDRDYYLAYTLTFFQMLAGAASTTNLVFFALITLYVLGGIWGLIIFNIKKECVVSESSIEVPTSLFGYRFFTGIVGVTLLSVVITLGLFFVIPRMGVGFFQHKTLDTVKTTGFDDTVELGSLGPIKSDSTVVMRVELPGYGGEGPPGRMYLRGTALTRYDGKSWTRDITHRNLVRGGPKGKFLLREDGRRLLLQNILLQPLNTEVLFGAARPVAIERVAGRFANLWMDASGSVFLPSAPFSMIEYRVWSSLAPVKDEPGPEMLDTSYTDKLPSGGKIDRLAEEVTSGAEGPLNKAELLETYLQDNFRYTLDPERTEGVDPVVDFLFHSREGYCEHYATAMVLLLREAGVPARLVTGFMQGEWNGLGSYYIVRQSDAHSWVEAYIDGTGWVTFDPTPSAEAGAGGQGSALWLYLDYMRMKWDRYIVQYSFEDQKKIATGLDKGSRDLAGRIKGALKSTEAPARNVALAVLLVAVLAALGYVLWGSFKAEAGKTPGFYLDMLKVLGRKGLVKEDSETPQEFARRTGNPTVTEITRVFHKARYAGVPLEPGEIEEVRKGLERLRKG